MAQGTVARRGRVAEKLNEIGTCLELVPMDTHFGNVSVGLYYKDGYCTVWSFSQVDGIEDRLREIRDQMVRLGGVQAVEGSDNQFIFPCGVVHMRPVKFLLSQAVTKAADFAHPKGPMTIRDSKSALTLAVAGERTGGGVLVPCVGRGRCSESGAPAADGGGGVHALRGDGEGGGYGGGVHLPVATR